MAKKEQQPPAEEKPKENGQPIRVNKTWYWARTALLAILVFIFVMWYVYPTRGNIAILWAGGLSAAMVAYFVITYRMLHR